MTPRRWPVFSVAVTLTPKPRRWPLLLVLAFVSLASVETVAAIVGPGRAAREADWEAAAAEVRAGVRPGDLIAFAPYWADQVGRSHLGDLMPVEMVARSDADRYGRIWELSVRGAHHDDVQKARELHATDHGRVRVTLYEKVPPIEVLHDFTATLGDARVTQQPASGRGEETPCYVDGDGFRCASTRVERRTLEIDYQPRHGALVPVDGSLVTRLEYPGVHLGSVLVCYAGLHDYYARKNADGVVDLALFVDGAPLGSERVANADRWKRLSLDTARFADGQPHTVRFEVKAQNAAWRNFGFHAEARR